MILTTIIKNARLNRAKFRPLVRETSRSLCKSYLSENYKSKKLWDERLSCKLLAGDETLVQTINNKIITNASLNNVELDVFVNIVTPRIDDTAQLAESVKQINLLRRSIYANTLLSSTSSALCRLFLASQRLPSLVHILGDRVNYGIFPDFFTMNLVIDDALDKEKYALASKLASYVMLQEEFGINHITDALSIISVSQYIENNSDFSEFVDHNISEDPVFDTITSGRENQESTKASKDSKKQDDQDEDEDEDDAEYIRIPFLRNPYNDNHFDLKNPRLICGKTLTSLGKSYMETNKELAFTAKVLGEILVGHWPKAQQIVKESAKARISLKESDKELCQYYLNNLNEIEAPSDDQKSDILSNLDQIPIGNRSLCEQARELSRDFGITEEQDIKELRNSFVEASERRSYYKRAREEKELREKMIQEIKAKKEELKLKEQFLFFYDDLKKKSITKLEYN